MDLFAPHQLDFYKTGHKDQYPKGTTLVYSNLTARSGKNSNVPDSKGIIFMGLQLFIKSYLIDEWNKSFFRKPKDEVVEKYRKRISIALKQEVSVDHIEALHDLGYLPLQIKALPEGSFIPYKVPMLTIRNTVPEFYWLTNYIESVMSCELWPMINSATTAREYLKVFREYANKTCNDNSFVPFQGHDFSYRGMFGRHAAAMSGFAHITCFKGTDSVSALDIAETYYGTDSEIFNAGSVQATEHSCMASSINSIERNLSCSKLFAEGAYFKHLITNVYPTGIVSIVSDTYDFWSVVSDILPLLKSDILTRDGKLVIRPDSGDPVDIICGTHVAYMGNIRDDLNSEEKGLIECLWDIFGGTINSKGYKELDPHIGAIYGDSITLKRQREILEKIEQKGFASNNIVLGVGSFSYQGNSTRDSHGIAMKSTYCEVNGAGIEIYKDPKTDDGTKKSAKGLLMVSRSGNQYELKDQCNWKEEKRGCLTIVYQDGCLVNKTSLYEIRERILEGLK